MKTEQTLPTEKITANSEQLAVLKNNFPQCFDKQGKFLVSKLQEMLQADGVDVSRESYSLNWLGKSYARVLANEPIRTMLSEDIEHNQQEQNKNSHNLLIQGDNLEVLKHLKGAYTDKIKMIYIDPPYNTGSDGFVYQDDRSFTPEQFAELAGVDLEEAKRILDFTQSNANSHSAWLTFIYPRLYIAKQLLKDDGVIFISIDDNEQAQLKILCDEVFGEANLVGNIIWNNVTDNNPTNIAIEHEYILCYAKNKTNIANQWKSKISDVKDVLLEIEKELISKHKDIKALQKEYSSWFKENKFQLWPLENYKFIDFKGIFSGERGVHNPGKEGYRYDIIHPKTGKPCKEPLMGYRFPEASMKKMIEEERIIFGDTEDKLVEIKVYVKDYRQKFSSVLKVDGRAGANELKHLFPEYKKVFTNPKTIKILEELIAFNFSDDQDGYILDFFAGSGTSAQATLEYNVKSQNPVNFICVQLNESISIEDKKVKNDFASIFEITKERIIRASKKLTENYPNKDFKSGFKIFKTCENFLPSSSYRELKQLILSQLDIPSAMTGFDEAQLQDILTTWKGLDKILLSENLNTVSLGDYLAYSFGHVLYLVNKGFNTDALKGLIQKLDDEHEFQVSKLVILGHHFDSKSQREIDEAMKNYNNKKSIPVDVVVRY
ncbi:site-specific DNA-methyltransferase [Acinetobacter sp. YH12236]|uniref:site-specific DNA-methyltransferase n=1 Tax=Acinetobacter sp. YH12236 TaxID=2601163 RepID=UPI0015D1DB98|nr:site-specific DNA-methyltransferase [Acinetobacter sp. YH12236]